MKNHAYTQTHTNLELAIFLLVSFGGHFGYVVGLSDLELQHRELTVQFSDLLVLLLHGLLILQGRLFKLLDGFLLFFFFGWSCARVKIGRVVMKKAREYENILING